MNAGRDVAGILHCHRHGCAVGFQPEARRAVRVLQNVLDECRGDHLRDRDQVRN